MPLSKFIFTPGINKEGTDYTAEGGWFDGNLVRFRKGLPEKIGGWQKYIQTSYEAQAESCMGGLTLMAQSFLALAHEPSFTYRKAPILMTLHRFEAPPVRVT